RLNDLVWFVCRRCSIKPISRGKIRRSVATPQLVCCGRLRGRVFCHASFCRLASRTIATRKTTTAQQWHERTVNVASELFKASLLWQKKIQNKPNQPREGKC